MNVFTKGCGRLIFNGVECDKILFNGVEAWQKEGKSELLYSVGLLSDVHIDTSSADQGDTYSQADFANALQFFRDNGCKMVCISGDLTVNGTDAEFAKYVELRDVHQDNMKVFACTGNHEAASSRTYTSVISDDTCIAHNIYDKIGNHYCYYLKNGQYIYWDISPDNYTVDTAQNVTIEDSSIVLSENDVYIFVGILGDRNNGLFWDGFYQWFYNVLNEHKSKRCFVFEHCRAEHAAGFSNGNITDEIYKDYVSGNPTGFYKKPLWGQADNGGVEGLRAHTMESLFAHFTNCLWFHGHTHAVAESNEISDIACVDTHFGDCYSAYNPAASANNTKWTWSVHIPSCCDPRSVDTGAVGEKSQGALMEVYADKVVIRYVNFAEVVEGAVEYVDDFIDTAVYELGTKTDAIGVYAPPSRIVSGEKLTLVTV